jgi:WD40-like Beta Propeller Repeat
VVAAVSLLSLAMAPVAVSGSAAQASDPSTGLPGVVPASFTPDILAPVTTTDSPLQPEAITQVGTQMVVGGTFNDGVQQAGSTTTLTRNYIFAMDASTGVISTTFAPVLDGPVNALVPGPVVAGDPTVYVGGAFVNVNGTKAKSLVLLDLNTGLAVKGFKAPSTNGVVNTLALSGSRLFVGGTFTKMGPNVDGGLAALDPSTGAYLSYVGFAVATNHNWTSTCVGCAKGAVGVQDLSVSPDGTRLVIIGNFKTAAGLARDQVAMVDLGATSATVDPSWQTQRFTAACAYHAFDSWVRQVAFSSDGKYFVITSTGGTPPSPSTNNCDSVARFETGAKGTAIPPTWSDYTGEDSLWGLATTPAVIYMGGHQRWLNNALGKNSAAAGAVPRPAIAALNPLNGLPYSWNPGRTPRGADTFAMTVTPAGLWIGYDDGYVGNYLYHRGQIAFFPFTGGETLPSDAASTLPGEVYVAGPIPPGTGKVGTNTLLERPYNGTIVGATTTVTGAPVDWSNVRGAFMADGNLFYGYTDGNLHRVGYDGTTWGTPTVVQPFNDPYWDNVQTGSGNTYQGVAPTFYGEITKVSGMFYSAGYLYYTLTGQTGLYYRYFEPEDGIVGASEFQATSSISFSGAEGLFASSGKVYWSQASTGNLSSATFTPALAGSPAAVSGSAVTADSSNDWNGYATFIAPVH